MNEKDDGAFGVMFYVSANVVIMAVLVVGVIGSRP